VLAGQQGLVPKKSFQIGGELIHVGVTLLWRLFERLVRSFEDLHAVASQRSRLRLPAGGNADRLLGCAI
jgi:hypothetical protein